MAKQKTSPSSTTTQDEKINEVIGLIRLMSETGLAELEVETSDLKVTLKKHATVQQIMTQSFAGPSPMPIPSGSQQAGPTKPAGADEKKEASDSQYHKICSPMAGTFYISPSPNSPPYVKDGDKVSAGQPVCIVEAMKLMNEIKADKAGKIVKVLRNNAEPVDKGTVLFYVDLKG